MEAKYNFSKYRNYDCKMLAHAYGHSTATFHRNTKAIKPKLDAIRKRIRPNSAKGPRYWNNEMLDLLFTHMGGEPTVN
jgi:hypothetical protein